MSSARAAEPGALTDALVRAVRLRLRRRLAWLAWRAERLGEGADSLLAALDDGDEPADEAAFYADQPEVAALGEAIAAADAELAAPGSRWAQLCDRLELAGLDAHVLEATVASALEPGLRRGFAALEGWKGRASPTIPMIARLFGHGRAALAPGAPVLRWELVRPDAAALETAGLGADPAVVAWLAGAPLDDAALLDAGVEVPLREALPGWPVAEARAALDACAPPTRLRVVGPAGIGRRSFAAVIAAAAGRRLYAVEGSDDAAIARERWRRACRRVRLLDEYLAWVGPPPPGAELALAPPQMFLVLTPQDTVAPLPDRVDPVVEVPLPDVPTRRALWAAAIPEAERWPAGALDQLAASHRVTVAEIAAVGALGVREPRAASEAVRAAGRGALGSLAQRLACTFTFDDLVTSPSVRASLEDLVFEARERLLVWEDPALRRLFPLGTGLLALFCGPPGTGKTMAAQVVARELGLDLYRIDLAAVVSKWVGETARNLDRVLATAARMDVVLFFDEADSLFGKRTDIRDAHDRYANTDTNYLLQAVEGYPGVALLATNRKGNVDGAFQRRLRHVIEFPAPDTGLRLQLWRSLVAAIGGDAASASTGAALSTLAASFELSGAQIKYAILHSLYTARREQVGLCVRHLLGGVERELQKEGRGIGRVERERLLAFDRGASA